MKKVIVITLFLISKIGFGQDYRFDNFYEYNTDGGSRFLMVNSENKNYLFFGYPQNDEIYGYIFDYNTSEFHYFNVKNYNNEVLFNYSSSRKLKNCKCTSVEKNIEFDVKRDDHDKFKSKTTIYKNKVKKNGKKSWRGEIELVYNNDEKSVFYSNHLNFFLHHALNGFDLNSVENKLPTQIAISPEKRVKHTFNLNKKKEINTLLSINKEQLNYN